MKRIHGWTLLGISGSGLVALLLGQSVLGQPETKEAPPLLPMPPMMAAQAETRSAPVEPTGALPRFEPAPVEPRFPSSPPVTDPAALVEVPISAPSAPAPLLSKTEPARQTASAPSLEVQPGRQQPAVSIEWGGPTTIRIHQPTPYQIVVRNTSTTPVHNVTVRHRLGQGVACKATEPPAANESGELAWNLGTLAPDQIRRIDLTLVSQTRGTLNNQATVAFSAVAAHQVHVREPQLLVKMRVPDKVLLGENITLIFVLSNPGDGVAEAVKLKMQLPEGLDHPRGKAVDFEVGNLAPKEVRSLQLVCEAKAGGTQQCTIAASGDGGLVSSDATQFEILIPRLDVVLSGPKLRYLDRHAVYVLKVTNPGSAPASNVEVQELIPAGFKFHQATLGGQYQEATRLVSWNLGELQPGQSKDVAVDLIPIEAGEHRLSAHAKAARGLNSQAEARTTVEGLPSLSIEVVHGDDPLEVGAETAYEIRLANTGTKTETNVEVVCTLPEQLEFRAAKCSTTLRFRQEGRELIFEPLARLAPKAEVIYRVQVRGVAPGDIRFRTRIKADGLKDPVTREENTRIYSDETPARPTTSPSLAPTKIKPGLTPDSVPLTTPSPTPSVLPAPSLLPTPAPAPAPTPSVLPPPGPLPMPPASSRLVLPPLPAPSGLPTLPANPR